MHFSSINHSFLSCLLQLQVFDITSMVPLACTKHKGLIFNMALPAELTFSAPTKAYDRCQKSTLLTLNVLRRECGAVECRFQRRRHSDRCNLSVAVHEKKNGCCVHLAIKQNATVTSQRTSADAEVKPPDGKTCRIKCTLGKFLSFFFAKVKRPYGKLLKRSKTDTR